MGPLRVAREVGRMPGAHWPHEPAQPALRGAATCLGGAPSCVGAGEYHGPRLVVNGTMGSSGVSSATLEVYDYIPGLSYLSA